MGVHYTYSWRYICTSLTDVDDLMTTTLRMYPVPANSTLTIDLPEGNDNQVELFTLSGQRVVLKTGLQNYAMIDVSEMNEGIYIVAVNGTQSGRVVVAR